MALKSGFYRIFSLANINLSVNFIGYFEDDYELGIVKLLNKSDLSFCRTMWELESFVVEDATKAESKIYEK